jgi:hypothetical protein
LASGQIDLDADVAGLDAGDAYDKARDQPKSDQQADDDQHWDHHRPAKDVLGIVREH